MTDKLLPEDDDMRTIDEILIRAMHKVNLVGKIHSLTVTSYPEEDIELLPGLKITNMIFTGERGL